ncbi:MAG TPA: carboxypeptidase regulatory-like domain-containing protein [Candidatus Aquilonibacter sp.]|nr:carboxypeptidase regulatory-like domain-containing protein [Candidatus Aquilonibacter sp.]
MRFSKLVVALLFVWTAAAIYALPVRAQGTGNASSITGTVTDPTGAVVVGATVTILNPVSGYTETAVTDGSGNFSFNNVPYNPYHLTVTSKNFSPYVQDVEVRSAVPTNLKITLQLAGASSTVTVTAGADLLETVPTDHTDISRQLFNEVPLESASSSVSSLVTETSPGIAADSNGLFHGLGDHAENSFSVDGQPITDQQSKVFSNQIPIDSIQSLEVIDGAPPAQYGDKTSVVIDVTTRSGLGETTPHGDVTASYGTFGTGTGAFDVGYGGNNWGNFVSLSGMNSGRFLDPPEFDVMHDKGNEENAFDRVDYRFTNLDTLQLNLEFTRSWFQTPNSFDATYASPWYGVVTDAGGIPGDSPDLSTPGGCVIAACSESVPATDQRSQILTYNVAPTYTHLFGSSVVYTLGAYVRHDQYNYYPSSDPFADLAPTDLQRETVSQLRFLTNAGVRTDLSYVKGIHNIKAGIVVEHTFLTENDNFSIVDPTLGPSLGCENPDGSPMPGTTCAYDLTNGGGYYLFKGHTDVKEIGMYVQDSITKGSWNFNLGVRGDIYHGITTARQAEPRVGIAYNIKPSNTVLRVSYARTLETPFNENLVLSSIGCANPILNPLLACTSSALTPISPGYRNEFHAGLEQAFGSHLVFDGEYIWKYTHNGYDFSVFGNTPITFPVEWARSKIPGFAARLNFTNFHGFTAYTVMSSVAARFFAPQVGGAGANPTAPSGVFRIDHDEKFNQETHFQYQIGKRGPWVGFNWRYDSGLVAGAAPCYGVNANNDCPQTDTATGGILMEDPFGNPLSADQEFEAGFYCGTSHPAPPSATNRTGTFITSSLDAESAVPGVAECPASQFGSTLISVPPPNTEDDDHRPPRIAQRNLFDVSLGDDNLFRGDKYKWSATITVINVTNKYALYNFLSTFSGTHYVTPRTVTGEIGFHF